ncbi:hypothetical protein PMAYCL1PPCAC_24147, partial [Pristionchus mayeri]
MTVGYMKIAATANLGTFLRLLLRWRGSVWKGVWRELGVWLFIYNWISLLYRFYLRGTDYGERFELLVTNTDLLMSHARTALIFVLGFYVSHIATRWWNVFMEIPWPDTIALSIAAFLHSRPGMEKEDRTTRVNMMRYIVVSYVLVFRDVCERIRLRFPTYNHLKPGLMTEEELRMLEKYHDPHNSLRMWMPIEWSLNLLKKCYIRRQISDVHFVYLTKEILKFRDRLQNIKSFDWINVPLVYSQVVSLSTTVYFLMCLIARQYIAIKGTDIRWNVDYVLPFFTIGEFICLVGWLKCAQVMINPFGQDDDDFEVDTLIERNLAVSMSMVDDLYDRAPPLARIDIKQLPGILDPNKKNPMVGSAVPLKMQANDMKMVDPNQEKWIKTGAQAAEEVYSRMDSSEGQIEDGLSASSQNTAQSGVGMDDKTKSGEDTSYKKLLAGSPTGKVHQNSQEDEEVKDENAKRKQETDDIMNKVLEKLIAEKHVMVVSSDFFEKDLDALLDKTQANSPKSSLPVSGNSNRPDKIKTPRPSGESMAEREDKTPESYSALASPIERTQVSGYTAKNTPVHSFVDMTGLMETPKKTPESMNATAIPQPRKTPTPQKNAAPSASIAKFDDGLNQLIEKLRAKEQHAKKVTKSLESQWKETPGKTPNRRKGSTPATTKRSREKVDVTAKTLSKDPINASKENTQGKTSSKDPLPQSKE